MNETRYPLYWPDGWKRCSNRERARFGTREQRYGQGGSNWIQRNELSVNDGVKRVLKELRTMGVSESKVIISTNVPVRLDGLPYSDRKAPSDPGVALYWQDNRGRKKCMAVDRYDRVADNIAAIAATLDAMRAIERHGGAEILERTFLGFAALPERSGKAWRQVLGFGDTTPTRDQILERYMDLARKAHPDAGGSHEGMTDLNSAKSAALAEVTQ